MENEKRRNMRSDTARAVKYLENKTQKRSYYFDNAYKNVVKINKMCVFVL